MDKTVKIKLLPLNELVDTTNRIVEGAMFDAEKKVKDPRVKRRNECNLQYWASINIYLTELQTLKSST